MVRQEIRNLIKNSIKRLQKEGALPDFEILEIKLEHPEEKIHGDYSTNIALIIAKVTNKNPMEIAENLKSGILGAQPKAGRMRSGRESFPRSGSSRPWVGCSLKSELFEKIEVANPGFINFWIQKKEIERLFLRVLKEGIAIFKGKPKKETIVIEYSSPNIAKPLGVHHLRSTIIGQALVNILRFAGYKVISLSFPGDWGTQFGLLIAAYKKWGNKGKLEKNPIQEMFNLYIRFSQAAKKDPELLEKGRREFRKLEEGDPENKKLWKWFSEESLRDFSRVYKLLDVNIENTIGESYYEAELKGLVRDALKRKIAQYGKDGSIIIQILGSKTPEIIQKSDGATIYTTRELAAIRHRLKKWRASKVLYVTANQQSFHLSQVFGCAEKLGIVKKNQLSHVKFGMMLAPGGKKFATREGRLIPLEKLLKEAVEKAKKVVEKLNPSLSKTEKEKIARAVGIGAVKFFDLSRNRLSDITFDWEQMLNLKGFSAPYIQYTYARLASILRKAKFKEKKKFLIVISHPLEREIIVEILRFDEVVEEISQNYSPNLLAEYLYELSNVLNSFYETLPVLGAKREERESRLNLVYGTKEILKIGLELLGISAPERM